MRSMSKEKLEKMKLAMTKMKVTIIIWISPDAADDYSAAETHIATIIELSKQDSNMIVLDNKGTTQVNYQKPSSAKKYKDLFQPHEKTFPNGTIQISVAHHILLTIDGFNKMLKIPFLKKNKVFIYFNQKDSTDRHYRMIYSLSGLAN
jgi:hypothetical protein